MPPYTPPLYCNTAEKGNYYVVIDAVLGCVFSYVAVKYCIIIHLVLKDLVPYMKLDTVSAIMDNILSSVLECNSVKEEVVVQLLHLLQLEEYGNQPVLSHDGFMKLLKVCSCHHSNVIDDLLLNVLQSHINTKTTSRSENRQCLASIVEDLCTINPSLTKLCSALVLDHTKGYDLLSLVDTGTITDWISHPSSARVKLTELVICHSKDHMKYFITTGIDLLSETISDNLEYVQLFLPLIKSYLQLKEG